MPGQPFSFAVFMRLSKAGLPICCAGMLSTQHMTDCPSHIHAHRYQRQAACILIVKDLQNLEHLETTTPISP